MMASPSGCLSRHSLMIRINEKSGANSLPTTKTNQEFFFIIE
jgi:hypothetical protein